MTRTVHFIHSYYTVLVVSDWRPEHVDDHQFTYYPYRIYREYRFSIKTNERVKRENHSTVRTSKNETMKNYYSYS